MSLHPSSSRLSNCRLSSIKLKQPIAFLAAALLMLTAACANQSEPASKLGNGSESAPAAEQLPSEDEAARLAEWEAQVQRTKDVLDSMDRRALIGEAYTKGPEDAEIVLLKFSDFECPYCAVAASNVKSFTEDSEDVLYIYKNLPLVSIHPEAMPAAKAAWAAGQQDKFWFYHDGLFAFQDKLGEDYYVALAEEIGLDMGQFERDRNSPEAQAAIDRDIELAESLQVRGTPTFFLNQYPLPGNMPAEGFKEAVANLKAEIQQEKSAE